MGVTIWCIDDYPRLVFLVDVGLNGFDIHFSFIKIEGYIILGVEM